MPAKFKFKIGDFVRVKITPKSNDIGIIYDVVNELEQWGCCAYYIIWIKKSKLIKPHRYTKMYPWLESELKLYEGKK